MTGLARAFQALRFALDVPRKMQLDQVIAILESIAPLDFAEPWDNVGLLLEPPGLDHVRHILLTIDLTEPVLEEALEKEVTLIVAYHPPIFSGLKRLSVRVSQQRLLLRAAQLGIAIYSPHTALDAARGGVNDWLTEPLEPAHSIPITIPAGTETSDAVGAGRRVELASAMPLSRLIERIKRHLGLAQVRLASSRAHGEGALIRSAAVCAGAGGGLFAPLSGVDLYLTGEMRHHDILRKLEQGASVILCDHSNTERGFLPVLARRLCADAREEIAVSVSKADAEPLSIV